MAFFFRKTIKIGLFNINLSGNGIGISLGVPGLRIGKSATGRPYVSGSLPGTGLRYRKTIKSGRNNK